VERSGAMKLYWMAVLLVVGVFLVGCNPERVAPAQPVAPTATTDLEAADIADKAIASMEAALQGTDQDAMMKAAQQLDLALGTLRSKLVAKDEAAEAAARKENTPAPASVTSPFMAASGASGALMGAVSATPPDTATAKTLLAEVKGTVDAARKALQ